MMKNLKTMALVLALSIALVSCAPKADTPDKPKTEDQQKTDKKDENKDQNKDQKNDGKDQQNKETKKDNGLSDVEKAVINKTTLHSVLKDGEEATLYIAVPSLNEEIAKKIVEEKAASYKKDSRAFKKLTIYFYPQSYQAPSNGEMKSDDAIGKAVQDLTKDGQAPSIELKK